MLWTVFYFLKEWKEDMHYIVKVLDIICVTDLTYVFSLVPVLVWEAGISFVHSNV